VSILEPGLDLIREVAPEAVRANQEIEAAFGKERIAALKATLNDLCDTLGESDGAEAEI
jgi:DNA-binding MarR family transcriptional regulator